MSNGPWSAEEKALFIQLRTDGLSMRQIAARLHRSETSLTRMVERLDVPRRPSQFQPAAHPKHAKRAGKTTLPPLKSLQ
jgi:transposase